MGLKDKILGFFVGGYENLYVCQDGDILTTEKGRIYPKLYVVTEKGEVEGDFHGRTIGKRLKEKLQGKKIRIVNYDDLDENKKENLEYVIGENLQDGKRHRLRSMNRDALSMIRAPLLKKGSGVEVKDNL
jgi:hypothetical protein